MWVGAGYGTINEVEGQDCAARVGGAGNVDGECLVYTGRVDHVAKLNVLGNREAAVLYIIEINPGAFLLYQHQIVN